MVGAEREVPSALRGEDVRQVEERLTDEPLAVVISEEALQHRAGRVLLDAVVGIPGGVTVEAGGG